MQDSAFWVIFLSDMNLFKKSRKFRFSAFLIGIISFVDGLHIGLFADELQKYLNEW